MILVCFISLEDWSSILTSALRALFYLLRALFSFLRLLKFFFIHKILSWYFDSLMLELAEVGEFLKYVHMLSGVKFLDFLGVHIFFIFQNFFMIFLLSTKVALFHLLSFLTVWGFLGSSAFRSSFTTYGYFDLFVHRNTFSGVLFTLSGSFLVQDLLLDEPESLEEGLDCLL